MNERERAECSRLWNKTHPAPERAFVHDLLVLRRLRRVVIVFFLKKKRKENNTKHCAPWFFLKIRSTIFLLGFGRQKITSKVFSIKNENKRTADNLAVVFKWRLEAFGSRSVKRESWFSDVLSTCDWLTFSVRLPAITTVISYIVSFGCVRECASYFLVCCCRPIARSVREREREFSAVSARESRSIQHQSLDTQKDWARVVLVPLNKIGRRSSKKNRRKYPR